MWLVIGIALPFASSRFRGIRNPQDVLIHDEMTYLVQADTFSRGRLTNPAPRHPEFFEAPYLLMEPTYQAKYPPAQALFLAIGRRFAGHPIWGVWLTCGLFAAALDWMLCGWVNRRWAMIGTAYAVAVLGITHSWATTYWGGMVAATGGALLLGGTRWTLRRWTSGRAVLTALGVVIVLNSRPYEGAVVCLACGTVLAWWLVCGSTEAAPQKSDCLVRTVFARRRSGWSRHGSLQQGRDGELDHASLRASPAAILHLRNVPLAADQPGSQTASDLACRPVLRARQPAEPRNARRAGNSVRPPSSTKSATAFSACIRTSCLP